MSSLKHSWPLIAQLNPKSPISEAYKILRTNINYSNVGEEIQTIAVTSAIMNEGKSTNSANIAVAYAQAGKSVLLIDADMRKPSQHHIFGITNRTGLSSVLSAENDLQRVIVSSPIDNLSLLPAGPIPSDPSELLSSGRMEELIEKTKEMFDLIIIDTPSVMFVADAQVVAAKCDGTIMVIGSGSVKKDAALKAKASLERVNARILGIVLNNTKRKGDEFLYYYSHEEREAGNG